MAEYVWVDAAGETRSKSRVSDHPLSRASKNTKSQRHANVVILRCSNPEFSRGCTRQWQWLGMSMAVAVATRPNEAVQHMITIRPESPEPRVPAASCRQEQDVLVRSGLASPACHSVTGLHTGCGLYRDWVMVQPLWTNCWASV